jgi:hypothetical protein
MMFETNRSTIAGIECRPGNQSPSFPASCGQTSGSDGLNYTVSAPRFQDIDGVCFCACHTARGNGASMFTQLVRQFLNDRMIFGENE